MKTVIRNSDHLAVYAGDNLTLTAEGVRGPDWIDPALTAETATLRDLTLPDGFVPCAYAFDGGWSVVNQPLIDAEMARLAAESATQTQRALAEVEAALDAHLDAVAQQYRFADRTRLALRAGYPNPWQAIGVAFGTWMDACNAMAAQGMQDFLDGKIPLQTPEQVIAQLPEFVAP